MLWAFLRHADPRNVEAIVVFFEPGPFEREVAALGISTIVHEAGRLRDLHRFAHVVRRLAADMRRERPDLVVNWMAKSHLYGATAAAAAGLSDRLVWWQHVIPTGDWLDRLATALPARAIGASSHATARAQQRVRPHRKIFVVHPGIDPQRRIVWEEATAFRRALSLPPNAAIIGCVGRLEPGRNQHRFLRALAMLRRRDHHIHGLLVGGNALGLWGRYRHYLERLKRDLRLEGAVSFTGQVPDASPYIAMLDVLVTPASEAFGIAVLEAMAMGVPVVAVNAGGAPEIIEAGRSGLLVPPDDEDQLADATERLIRDPALRARLAHNARERVTAAFDANTMANELRRHLEHLSRDAPRPTRSRRAAAHVTR